MKKTMFRLICFLVLLFTLFCCIEKAYSLHVQSRQSQDVHAATLIQSERDFLPYNVVNFHQEKPRVATVLIPYNEKIQRQYQDEPFPFVLPNKPSVCVIDHFTPLKHYNYEFSHGELVSRIINQRFSGDIWQYNANETSYSNYDFNECDVINYSMVLKESLRSERTFAFLERFMRQFEGIVVAAAGNEGESFLQSEWAGFKNQRGEETSWMERVILVTQGIHRFNHEQISRKENVMSYGEEVDVIVFNGNEHMNTYALNGSSYATPVVTSIVANYLGMGVPPENIKAMILQSGKTFTDQHGYRYTELHVKKAHDTLRHVLNN